MADPGCFTTSPDRRCPIACWRSRRLPTADRAPPAGLWRSSGCSSRATCRPRSRWARRAGSCVAAAGAASRCARPRRARSSSRSPGYGAADKEQVGRMVQLVLGHGASCRRPTTRPMPSRSRSGPRTPAPGVEARRSAVVDRAAVAPITRGQSAYDRAVNEALAKERGARRTAPTRERLLIRGPDARFGRRDRRGGHARFARDRGGRAGLPRVRGAGGAGVGAAGSRLKLHTYHLVREDQQALYGFRTAEELGFFNLLLTVTGVGPKVALAIVGTRPTPDLQLAIMAQDQAVLGRSRESARSWPSGPSSSSRRR